MAPREHTSQGHCQLITVVFRVYGAYRCSRHRKLVWSGGPELCLSRISTPYLPAIAVAFHFTRGSPWMEFESRV